MRTRVLVSVLTVVAPAGTLLLLLVPRQERAVGDDAVRGLALAVLGACLVALAVAFTTSSGRDSVHVDDVALHLRSQRYGDADIPWGDLIELGWVTGGHEGPTGLAGRRRTGGRYEPGGPHIAGWLARPALRVLPPRLLRELRRLCAQHDVTWRDYGPAEVM